MTQLYLMGVAVVFCFGLSHDIGEANSINPFRAKQPRTMVEMLMANLAVAVLWPIVLIGMLAFISAMAADELDEEDRP